MEKLIKQIEQWASDRNIIKGSKPIDQAMKLFSEFGELADNVGKGRDCRDDVGDVFIVLTIIAAQYGNGIMVDCVMKDEPVDNLSRLTSIKHVVHVLASHLYSFVYSVEDSLFCDPSFDLKACIQYLEKITELCGYTLEECVQIAYDDIKYRKGIMANGIFIKESDPVYAQVISEIEGNYNA